MQAFQSASTPQFCHCNTKIGIDNTETSEHGCSNKTLFIKQIRGQIWPLSHTPTPGPAKTKRLWSTINIELKYAEKLNLLMKENEKLAKV